MINASPEKGIFWKIVFYRGNQVTTRSLTSILSGADDALHYKKGGTMHIHRQERKGGLKRHGMGWESFKSARLLETWRDLQGMLISDFRASRLGQPFGF